MNLRALFVLGCLCLIGNVVCNDPKQGKDSKVPRIDTNEDVFYPTVEFSNTFDWQLFREFSDLNKNVIISPISLKIMLAFLYEGAFGSTETEIRDVLKFPENKTLLRESFLKTLDSLHIGNGKEFCLNLESRIFLDTSLTPEPSYCSNLLKYYQAKIESTEFSNQTKAASSINSWIDQLTKGHIKELVHPEDLENALMVLTNGIYFKGEWVNEFPKNRTETSGFYVSHEEAVLVPFMSTVDAFYYCESTDLDAKLLRLPYKGNKYSMIVVLPNSKAGLPSLLKHIKLETLSRQLWNLDKLPVEVIMPKFKFNFLAKYAEILQRLGLKEMFQNTAMFSRIAKKQPNLLRKLVVSDVLQKSGIEIDEEGSVVYTASDIQIGNKFGDIKATFNASRPFMFFILEETKGTILFVGKVQNPLEGNVVAAPLPLQSSYPFDQNIAPSIAEFSAPAGGNKVQESESIIPLNLQPYDPQFEAQAARFNYFDLELLREFSDTRENVLISPATVKATLAMLLEGSHGKTSQEIEHTLRIDLNGQSDAKTELERLLFDIEASNTENTKLQAANALFASKNIKVLPNYQKKITNSYKADIKYVDFNKLDETIKTINDWATNATHGEIREIVDKQTISPDGQLLLSNALYFNGQWKTKFDAATTKPKCFNSLSRGCVMVPTMKITTGLNYNFMTELNSHVVELPYEGDKYSMLLVVPGRRSNVKVLAKDIQHAHFSDIVSSLRQEDVSLEMPRFEIDYFVDLTSYLKAMKIESVFTNAANLTGIADSAENLHVGSVIQKAKLKVDEKGTVAAAVNSAIVIPLMNHKPQFVEVDRPFIFFIYNRQSQNIIFEGIYVEPPMAAPVAERLRVSRPHSYRQRHSYYGR